jgi:hypothetical protein
VWDYLPISSLMDMQRRETVRQAGERIQRLHEEGYSVEADRMLDELGERMRSWSEEKAA